MNGDGKHHYSTIGSEIDIDSYLAGLYYRYDRNNWWTFATVYGGIQRVDLKTKDGIKSDTDGTEFGGSVELGYDYAINKTLYLTPSVGAFYTQVDYDDATDSAGKIAKYNTLRQLELEAGVKLTKAFVMDEGYANVYVKPSVVRKRLLTVTKFGSPVWAKSTLWMTRRWAGLNSAVATASPNSCRPMVGRTTPSATTTKPRPSVWVVFHRISFNDGLQSTANCRILKTTETINRKVCNMEKKDKALDAALTQIERTFGKGSIMRLGQNTNIDIEAISTGSLGTDIALGIGGLPKGGLSKSTDRKSSGKTTFALSVVAQAQKKGGICAFVDAEHALDPSYAKKSA